MNTIYTFLELVKQRPAMYISDYKKSLKGLEEMIWGYYQGLSFHKIYENVPSMNRHFLTWLGFKKDLLFLNYGWAYAIKYAAGENENLLDTFFSYVDEYKELKPVLISSVEIIENNNNNDEKNNFHDINFLNFPVKAEIIKYSPEKMYFVRLQFKNYIYNERLFTNSATNEIKKWMLEKYKINIDSWKS